MPVFFPPQMINSINMNPVYPIAFFNIPDSLTLALTREQKYILLSGAVTGLQCFSSTISSSVILAKLAILNSAANVTNTLYNFIGRDVIGQTGGALYSFKHGHEIRNNPTETGKMSYLAISSAQLTEMSVGYSPLAGKLFSMPIILANVLKNIGWMGSGAVNSHYMATISGNNISEFYTQISVSNSLGSTLGSAIGLYMSKYIIIPSSDSGVEKVTGMGMKQKKVLISGRFFNLDRRGVGIVLNIMSLLLGKMLYDEQLRVASKENM